MLVPKLNQPSKRVPSRHVTAVDMNIHKELIIEKLSDETYEELAESSASDNKKGLNSKETSQNPITAEASKETFSKPTSPFN
jgi:hypothetical protein